MNGGPGTSDVEPKDAESTQASVSKCKPINYRYDNDKYRLECAECKRLVRHGCTSFPTYQRQLFLTKGYQKKICCKCVEIPSLDMMPYFFKKTKLTLKLLLRNWKENSGSKKKDSLRSVTWITMHLLKLKDL